MIEDLLKNEHFRRYFPPVAGIVFVAVFANLGLWQLDRAAEKNAMQQLFESEAPWSRPSDFSDLEQFQRIEVFGHYEIDRQVLIDNIVLDGRLGYYVITPLRRTAGEPMLLVNRGWVPKQTGQEPDVRFDEGFGSVRGLVGHLPRVGIRPGEAFAEHGDWPRTAVYPTLDEVAAELDEGLLPVVLLLAPDEDGGFVRRWEPNVSGPMTHYSYAFQWFAMAAAVIAIMIWHLRKGRRRDPAEERP